jgi:hypothetical protein
MMSPGVPSPLNQHKARPVNDPIGISRLLWKFPESVSSLARQDLTPFSQPPAPPLLSEDFVYLSKWEASNDSALPLVPTPKPVHPNPKSLYPGAAPIQAP